VDSAEDRKDRYAYGEAQGDPDPALTEIGAKGATGLQSLER
jgi:hypothetical protein